MASGGAGTGPPSVDPQRTYKGHPQPEVDERLEQAKNFLADEDINRCLGFTSKLTQIEEYVKYIEKDTIHKDANLLNDVKVMAKVHRDWIKSQNDPPPNTTCSDGPSIQPYSSRLICAETALALQAEREAMGVAGQMREDHAPFTISREEDHAIFMKKLNDDARADPDTIDRKTNLLWLENSGYRNALQEPAMVPYWMHPRVGISKKGIAHGEEEPWYRRKARHPRLVRPPPQQLPDYLKQRENEINRLLGKKSRSSMTPAETSQLNDLLHLHHPPDLQKTYTRWKYQLGRTEVGIMTPAESLEWVPLDLKFQDENEKWLETFQHEGVQIMVPTPNVRDLDLPGLFYVQPRAIPTSLVENIERAQQTLNFVLTQGYDTLPPEGKLMLQAVLQPCLPGNLVDLQIDIADLANSSNPLGRPQDWNQLHDLNKAKDRFDADFDTWVHSFPNAGVHLEVLHNGEMPRNSPGLLSFSLPFERNAHIPLLKYVAQLQLDINSLLGKRLITGRLTSDEEDSLTEKLDQVDYPALRAKKASLLNLEHLVTAQAGGLNQAQLATMKRRREDLKTAENDWRTGFAQDGVQIKIPLPAMPDERPGVLCHRDLSGSIPEIRYDEYRDSITGNLQSIGDLSVGNSVVKDELVNFQHPRMKALWDEIKNIDSKAPNATQDEVQRRSAMYVAWSRMYTSWVSTFQHCGVVDIKKPAPEDPDDDPRVVYYRGTQPALTPLLQPLVDPELTLSEVGARVFALNMAMANGETDEANLASALEHYLPSRVRVLWQAYLDFQRNCASNDFSGPTKDDFVQGFNQWESEIRQRAAPTATAPPSRPSSPLPPGIPTDIQEEAKRINDDLQKMDSLSPHEVKALDARIIPYWKPQLDRLRDRAKRGMRQKGVSAVTIQEHPFDLESFRPQFDSFKAGFKHGGFRIMPYQPPYEYYAPDAIQFSDSGYGSESSGELGSNGESTNYNSHGDRTSLTGGITNLTGGSTNGNGRGANGTNGINGANGTNGVNGANGANGVHEVTAANGNNGNNGTNGTNGTNGINGTNGNGAGTNGNGGGINGVATQALASGIPARLPKARRIWLTKGLMDIEDEINALLTLRRQRIDTRPELRGREVRRDEYDRLAQLMQRFMPHELKALHNSLHLTSHFAPQDDTEGKRYFNKLRIDFTDRYNAWIRPFIFSGARIKVLLLGAGPDDELGVLYIEQPMPAILSPRTSPQLVVRESLPVQYQIIETTINNLLAKAHEPGGLDVQEIDDLTEQLRWLMPLELRRLLKRLRVIDRQAREQLLPETEREEFWLLWNRWNGDFYPWIDTFQNAPIKLIIWQDGDPVVPAADVLYVPNDLDPATDLPTTIIQPRNLPRHIEEKRHQLEAYLLGDDRDYKPEQIAEFDKLLRPMWRYIGRACRAVLVTTLRTESSRDSKLPLTPEQDAYIESFLAFRYAEWKQSKRQKTQLSVNISERVRGTFVAEMVWTNLNGTQEEMETAELEDALADAREDPGRVPAAVAASRLSFIRLARMLRNFHTDSSSLVLDKIDRERLSTLLTPMSVEALDALRDKAVNLLNRSRSGAVLSRAEDDLLQGLLTRSHFQQLGYLYPYLRTTLLSNEQTQTPARELLRDRLPGSKPVIVPDAPQPTENEVKRLEIVINNLLKKYRDGTLVGDEASQLDWLLLAALSPRLQILQQKIDALVSQFAFQPGLNMSDSLRLGDYRRLFEEQYRTWKDNLPAFGLILDEWWVRQETIANVYARATQWNLAVNSHARSTGPADERLQDPEVQILQTIYGVLKDYAVDSVNDHAGLLELNVMPPDLRDTHDKMISARTHLPEQTATPMSDAWHRDAAEVQRFTEAFICNYILWYASRRPTIVARLHTGPTDFSPKAERRGIQRAAVEIALNQLATNKEQHRPHDRFRIVNLPRGPSGSGPNVNGPGGPGTTGGGPSGSPIPAEVPLWLPLEPWKRPVELDTFEFIRNMVLYRHWKDFDYQIARDRSIAQRSGKLQAPANRLGPSILPTGEDAKEILVRRKLSLGQIYSRLAAAEERAPRPFIQQLILNTRTALALPEGGAHPLLDEVELTKEHLDIVQQIAEPSWHENRLEHADLAPDADRYDRQGRTRLVQFECELHQIRDNLPIIDNIPWWRPAAAPAVGPAPNDIYQQIRYDESLLSVDGMTLDALLLLINEPRVVANIPLWNILESTRHLKAMHTAHRIHFDSDPQTNLSRVSRIPPEGHPENKYVLSRAEAHDSAGVHRHPVTGALQVRYDAQGIIGLPIVQPNKNEFLPLLAFRLGRDINRLMITLSQNEATDQARLQEVREGEAQALRLTNQITPADRTQQSQSRTTTDSLEASSITLQRMAQDLDRVAPELSDDAAFPADWDPLTMTEEQAATLIQMQILEELNNNWESRFPENEHVWEFATQRVTPITITHNTDGRPLGGRQPLVMLPKVKNFFSMRRWPVTCQCEETQKTIFDSGPVIQPKPDAAVPPHHVAQRARAAVRGDVRADVRRDTTGHPQRRERHIRGQMPNFPFGETPYQQAYLSWRMEQDLKDVPEFQPPPPRRTLLNPLKRKTTAQPPSVDRFALPKLPENWTPTNITKRAKILLATEAVRNDPAMPSQYEDYYTQQEIANIKRKAGTDAVTVARNMLEREQGPFDGWADAQKNEFYRANGIDGMTGRFLVDPATRNIDPATGLLI